MIAQKPMDEGKLRQILDEWEALDEKQKRTPRNLYRYQPARAAYDTQFGGRREARDIAALFRRVRREISDPTDGYYMAALAGTLEQMDIQLYEHYRVLADLLLEAAQLVLPELDKRDDRAVGALLKGVRLGLLDEEKYLPPALSAFEELPYGDDALYQAALEEYRRAVPS